MHYFKSKWGVGCLFIEQVLNLGLDFVTGRKNIGCNTRHEDALHDLLRHAYIVKLRCFLVALKVVIEKCMWCLYEAADTVISSFFKE